MKSIKIQSLKSNQPSLAIMLVYLTLFFVAAQITFFIIHYKVSSLIDALVDSSITLEMLHPAILLPLAGFFVIQILIYTLFVCWTWFVATSIGEVGKLSAKLTYGLGLLCWVFAASAVLLLNQYFFPDSFFANLLPVDRIAHTISEVWLGISLSYLLIGTLIAYFNFFWFKRHRLLGGIFLLLMLISGIVYVQNRDEPALVANHTTKPNVIIIGLDSLRPDFTHYYGNTTVKTPHIDQLLQSGASFSNAYTPLARTFPSWITILTGSHPIHSEARNNLVQPTPILKRDTLAKRLQQAGYETIYATDEKRFSNITQGYGFDQVLGPKMGADDFLLGSLNDFPLSNLFMKLPIGSLIFPYNYGNRAAAITYDPQQFLQLVKTGLANRPEKPLFLAIHLCLSHWPFTWARDGESNQLIMPDRYRMSVQAVDAQLGALLQILKEEGLLKNSMVVLLSDHGTALGLPGDRLITEKNYHGDPAKMRLLSVAKLSRAPEYTGDYKHDYTISTTYGQGTDLLSFAQYHVLLAFNYFYDSDHPATFSPIPSQRIAARSSLLDITPTLLQLLHLPPMSTADGTPLTPYFNSSHLITPSTRDLFMETGDRMSEIETDHIYVEKVIKHEIGVYDINPRTGLLEMNPIAAQSIVNNKQRGVLQGDWLLVRFPAHLETKLEVAKYSSDIEKQSALKNKLTFKSRIVPVYYVLMNVKTHQWTIDFNSSFAKTAPVPVLLAKLKGFYGKEM